MEVQRKSREIKLEMPWGHIAAKAWGSHKDAPVLLVHGTLDNAGSFTRLIQLLPENHYYIAIDLPGHGLSSHLPPGIILDFFNYVLVIKYVLDQLKWDECMYIGHSFGAQLGIIFSVVFPNRLTKIVVFDGLIPKEVNDENIFTRIKQVNEGVIFDLGKKTPPLYTKLEVLDALQNRRQFSLNEAAAQALFERSVTKIGDMYQYNRDLRVRQFIYPNMNFGQYVMLMKHQKVPVLLILASVSWFHLSEDSMTSLQRYKKIFPDICTIIHVEGNHDVHNNNPERVASSVCTFFNFNDNTKSKL